MTTAKLRRLIALDSALWSDAGLHLPTFAEEWGISTRQISRRDLKLVRSLGFEMHWERDRAAVVWSYLRSATHPLFCVNWKRPRNAARAQPPTSVLENAANAVLRRWMALDRVLFKTRGWADYGVNLAAFAKHWSVSEKTVQRDLEAFKELGFEATPTLSEGFKRYLWHYRRDIREPMFAANLPVPKGIVVSDPRGIIVSR